MDGINCLIHLKPLGGLHEDLHRVCCDRGERRGVSVSSVRKHRPCHHQRGRQQQEVSEDQRLLH